MHALLTLRPGLLLFGPKRGSFPLPRGRQTAGQGPTYRRTSPNRTADMQAFATISPWDAQRDGRRECGLCLRTVIDFAEGA